jgi:uncharacterized membrane protein
MSIVTQEGKHRFPEEGLAPAPQTNVGVTERWLSVAAGIALLAIAPKQGVKGSVISALAGSGLLYRGWTGHCWVYQTLHNHSHPLASAAGVRAQHGVRFEKSIIINRPAESIYAFWRDLKKLPQIIAHLESVVEEGNRSHWLARGPLGQSVEWDAEIIEERPNEILAWQSVPNSQLDTAGSFRLKPLSAERGTAVRLILKYDPPGGSSLDTLAKWLGTDVEDELVESMRRMKQLLEAGELSTTERQPQGTCSRAAKRRGES